MPHLKLEVSQNVAQQVDLDPILTQLVTAFSSLETVDSRSLKAYARVAETWVMGAGAPSGFAALTACVLSGRSDELKARFADALFPIMLEAFGNADASVTVEIRDMDRASYRK